MSCIIRSKKCLVSNHKFTKEHIFPERIGGNLCLKDLVCEDCNSYLGNSIDYHLIEHVCILPYRYKLNLVANKSGSQNIVGVCKDEFGRTLQILQDGKIKISPIPKEIGDKKIAYIAGTESIKETF